MNPKQETNPSSNQVGARPASLWRRAAAVFYDSLFVLAILILATFIVLPLHHGEAMPQSGPIAWAYQAYLVLCVGVYFAYFWCKGGQTPGMKVWHIRVVLPTPCFGVAFMRFFGGAFSLLLVGIPFWLALFDDQKRSLIDRIVGSRVIQLPKP